jgi:hypothetical protein
MEGGPAKIFAAVECSSGEITSRVPRQGGDGRVSIKAVGIEIVEATFGLSRGDGPHRHQAECDK